jgi:hypothetical protein
MERIDACFRPDRWSKVMGRAQKGFSGWEEKKIVRFSEKNWEFCVYIGSGDMFALHLL